ncbi:VOC family protein [Tenacibaculum caenipelagi]|uniref:Extradiol dioxygenase family protein n=1 Tax=Tenacibaculum caenipelagi TaxID=1325435 RepID=A0A4R6THZ1_9FLAO|nr:VOC family protein [Tenacibaculum caenipelagi]TDQ30115.1 extradiol dioxygenase family protein [Tenacibaculum caenipelagi]
MKPTFHISLPCLNIEETIKFYTENLGFECGRKNTKWVDINLFNNQLTFVLADQFNFEYPSYSFEKDILPSFHFGVVLDTKTWEEMYQKVSYNSSEDIMQKTFLKDKNGEHISFFIKDPNGYTLEFKHFLKEDLMFAS